MRLLRLQDDGSVNLVEHFGGSLPYAILSHTWGSDDEEVTFKDLIEGKGRDKKGYRKLLFCGQQAARHGIQHFWVDTCSIDKASSAELSEAINSMFRWYKESERCYVYLSDVSNNRSYTEDNGLSWELDFRKSKWFTRGWTLQELLAPRSVEFFSREGQLLGEKHSLKQILHEATGIAHEALEGDSLEKFSVEERLSWAAKRITKREEDAAYSLLGIFGIHMPLIYGEGQQNAFHRLQREIQECSRKKVADFPHNNRSRSERLHKIHLWLSAPDPSTSYRQALKRRQNSTGLWFLKSDQYLSWKNNAASFLWLHGIPGSGKTILSSTIVQDLLRFCHDDSEKAIAYFYFDSSDAKKQNAELMLRSLICQLSQRSVDISPSLDKLYSIHENERRQLSSDAFLKIIYQMMQKNTQTYIVIDALDECFPSAELMEIVAIMTHWRLPNSHLIVTSRQERGIEITLNRITGQLNSVCMECQVVDQDIRQYIQQRMSADKALNKWGKDPILRQEIETALIQGPQQTFLWTVYQLDSLAKCRNRATLRKTLATLPPTLDKTYDRILCAITEEDSAHAIRILRWLTFAKRPLSIDEIAQVTAIDVDHDPVFDQEEVLEDPMETLDICSNLISITTDLGDGKLGSTRQIVVLAHYSIKEYLLSKRIRTGRATHYSMDPGACHSYLARGCLEYLTQMLQAEFLSFEIIDHATLARYSAEFWMSHAREAECHEIQATEAAVRLLSIQNAAYLNWLRIYDPERPWDRVNLKRRLQYVPLPLYYASLFGLAAVVELLLDKGTDVNAQGWQRESALQVASRGGHERIVKLLLAHGAYVHAISRRYGNALQAASERGYEQVAKILIDAGANVNAQRGRVLDLAIKNDHVTVVKLLLENGADVAITGQNLRTPLSSASDQGNVDVVKLLLKYGADVTTTDTEGWTPINSASSMGYFDIVKLLIENGADVTTASKSGWTAVNSASNHGHLDIVKLLIEHGADATISTSDGWTPVNSASSMGHFNIVKLLIENGADVTTASKSGWTPVNSASNRGHLDIVKLLIEYGADATVSTNEGWTPLMAAANNGHYAVVQLLLDCNDDDLDVETKRGHSALFHAITKNNHEIIKLLLQQGAKLHREDIYGVTAVSRAADRGHIDLLTQLLTVPGINPDERDRYGRTLTWWAAAGGQAATVKLLLHEYRSDPNIADKGGRTPSMIAMRKGNGNVLDILHGIHEESDVVKTDEYFHDISSDKSYFGPHALCDICTMKIRDTDFRYHCRICAHGDFDICAECKELGLTCMDDTHELVKRTMRNNVWVKVA